MAGRCGTCYAERAHGPDCPELRWPDGRLRGTPPNLPLPPFLGPEGLPDERYWSPLSESLAGILGPVATLAVENHLRAQRKLHEEDRHAR